MDVFYIYKAVLFLYKGVHMNTNIEELIRSFYSGADDSKHLLQEILDLVTSGRVPERELVDHLDISINDLRSRYEAVKDCAVEGLYKEELPPDGSSVDEYAKAIENSKKAEYEKALNDLKQILEEFVAVRSLVAAYSEALRPFQTKAIELLGKIKSDKDIDLGNAKAEAEGPRAFMDALVCSDYDSEENMLKLEKLPAYFPFRVGSGVSSGKYFVDNEVRANSSRQEAIDEISATAEPELHEIVENAAQEIKEDEKSKISDTNSGTTIEEAQSPDMDDVSTYSEAGESSEALFEESEPLEENDKDDLIEDDPEEIEASLEETGSEEAKEVSPFVSELIENHCIFDKSYNFGLLNVEKDEALEKKKISSSIFSGEIRKGNEAALKAFIREVIKKGYVSRDYLVDVIGYKSSHVDTGLNYLIRSGYLRKYTLFPGGSFYCSTERLTKALTFKESSRLVGVKQLKAENIGEPIEDISSAAMARLAYTKINEDVIKRLLEENINKYTETSMFGDEYFLLRTSSREDKDICEISFGAFWTKTDDCDRALNLLSELFEKVDYVDRYTVACVDFESAEALMEVSLKNLNYDLTGVEEWLYSMADDSFRRYDVETPEGQIDDESDGSADESELEAEEANEEQGIEDALDEEPLDIKEEDENAEDADILKEDEHKDTAPRVEATKKEIQTVETTKQVSDDLESTKQATEDVHKEKGNDDIGIICDMLSQEHYYAASAYAKVCDTAGRIPHLLYEQLAYALNDPMAHCIHSTDNVYDLISKDDPLENALVISIAIRTFYSNQVRYDYNIKPFYDSIKGYELLQRFPELSKVVHSLMDFKNKENKGVEAYTEYDVDVQENIEQEFNKVRQAAETFYNYSVLGKKKETASLKRFIETKKLLFSKDGEIGIYLKYIADGNKDSVILIKEFLENRFFREESVISKNSIDNDMLWDYIVEFWNKAGKNMMYHQRSDLMGSLRNNITNMTIKALQIFIDWCDIVEKIDNKTEDEGTIAYKRIKGGLLNDISNAINEIKKSLGSKTYSSEEKAGLSVIIDTLTEIKLGIEKGKVKNKYTYYYVPFLLTDDVMLDDGYMPDLEMYSCTVHELQPGIRILQHLKKLSEDPITIRDRLSRILDEEEDNLGAARLIIENLTAMETDEDLTVITDAVEEAESFAKDTARIEREDFVGDIELAQSYGQIDNSYEDRKEKILQIVDEWYEWAMETSNYGFFKKVMEAYREEIRESAKSREADLLKQVRLFKEKTISGIPREKKEKRIEKILTAIKEQNYTVAEDLLARASLLEDDYEESNDIDFLEDFLKNYESYCEGLSQKNRNLSDIVSKKLRGTHNKETRGGRRLIENWLPGGADIGKTKLCRLLNLLGFKVTENNITQLEKINNKSENYFVFTEKTMGSKRGHYPHPVAAFGSGAETDGFRVVCFAGNYKADSLIDLMKEIGNLKHTLILMDSAMDLPERRKLARKTKNSLGDKLFAVIDRVVLMYLVQNYDETKINRMLMSLIVPFGYYQPYVWESASPIPPELFMGRKVELEKIKSPSGVNIVYGGRQLGKSALLKKAKEEIDKDENGDRAVYIDIKDQNYKQVAERIGADLFDQGILEEDPDTDDWRVLSRAIRKRLSVEEKGKKIPYLLILLDEADAFIESCESVKYAPLDILKEIQNIGVGRFKFVIAGLHNIVRFKHVSSVGGNSGIPQFSDMTVKPFNTFEARELLEVPLYYLGMRFPKEKESLISLILATTNYFPGLIQMYCAKLIEAMRHKDYANYSEVNTPVYEVSEGHIKKILADKEFNEQIRQKYEITLRLGEDNYYYIIALLMAYLYHRNGYSEGYTAKDIKDAGTDLEISKISDLEIEKLSAYMEELCDLNVLRNTDDNRYLFTRFTFFQMMGTSDDVEEKLMEYM